MGDILVGQVLKTGLTWAGCMNAGYMLSDCTSLTQLKCGHKDYPYSSISSILNVYSLYPSETPQGHF